MQALGFVLAGTLAVGGAAVVGPATKEWAVDMANAHKELQLAAAEGIPRVTDHLLPPSERVELERQRRERVEAAYGALMGRLEDEPEAAEYVRNYEWPGR